MKKIFICIALLFSFCIFTILPCFAEMVMYNTKTNKYHYVGCKWAKKCTVNCIKIDKKQAQKRGGIPCKVCSG